MNAIHSGSFSKILNTAAAARVNLRVEVGQCYNTVFDDKMAVPILSTYSQFKVRVRRKGQGSRSRLRVRVKGQGFRVRVKG